MKFDPMETTRHVVRRAKKRVIPNWQSRINDYSTRALAACTVLPVAWQQIPDDWKSLIPAPVLLNVVYILSAIAAAGLFGKFLTQPAKGRDD